VANIRVLWLLNHTTLRRFEVSQLRDLGVAEIFLPKSYPYDEGNLSASIDHSQDAALTIPQSALDVLNAQDWYTCPSEEAWSIVNRYFDIAVIGFFPRQIDAAVRFFKGRVVLRVFGLTQGYSYSRLLYEACGETTVRHIIAMGSRFWFGAGYEHLQDVEEAFLSSRTCYLPVGLADAEVTNHWQGQLEKILFVCPRIGTSPYFEKVYRDFITDFQEFDYSIGGAQPVGVPDEKVLGFVSAEQHASNMRQHRLMFYHSAEPNHIHYHPFEAIRAGMPLLFMAGGMLDRLGGKDLPGRCVSISDARRKARRILAGDTRFIEQLRFTQVCLLDAMSPQCCTQPWQEGFGRILEGVETARRPAESSKPPRRRIAVIVPVGYRGGSLRGAKLLAQALLEGSRQAGEPAEVVLLHLDHPGLYEQDTFDDLPPAVVVRPFQWKHLDRATARRAMVYAGYAGWQPRAEHYQVADDGINSLQDCDAWVVVSDRLDYPLLPMRPVVLMVYDYLQRYVDILCHGADQPYLDAARSAERVMVTTTFTLGDALQYAGVAPRKLSKVPMLAPDFTRSGPAALGPSDYFVWTTNTAPHKNHSNALKALKLYYEAFDGRFACYVTGVETRRLFSGNVAQFRPLVDTVRQSSALRRNLKVCGELPEREYQKTLARSAFLWHAGAIDNGTFSVIEAAGLGVPALSSDYPAMREIDKQFSLNLLWAKADDPRHMAAQLKEMEISHATRRALLPGVAVLRAQSVESLAQSYWQVVKSCL
jgi:glycosyltransferase involved in cell wall biosynthesis